ncbi:unnamed protein product [Allacma fusca]|uniref:Peptidase M12A domain-containing protein n=1 Tax=Allacma fusca TaxID=39272 RepID=A0A8J2NR79_9HEXA|nr:unnamed protein product [Allacma fusca]
MPESYRWPNGTMPYEFDPAFSSSERDMILRSFKAIGKKTCVDFVKRKKEKDWVYFERTVDQGCASDNRSDRDDYITINWDNIPCGYHRRFVKVNSTSVATFDLPYDYVSIIMHYSNNEGGIDPDVPVLIPKPNYGLKIGNNKLSLMDILRINRMYNCDPAK